jgi:hypothetical protein
LGSDDSSVDNDGDVEEKDEPEEDAEGEEEGEQEAEPEEEEDEVEEEGKEGKGKKPKGESTEDAAPKPPKPPKAPKPLNYKRKKLLYVAATRPANTHMLNRQLDIKKVNRVSHLCFSAQKHSGIGSCSQTNEIKH